MNINPAELTKFRIDFAEAVASLEEKYDITISLGAITYSRNDFHTTMIVDNGHDPEEIRRRKFDENVWKYEDIGFEPGMYRRIFISHNGKRYAILGFHNKAKKYPLIVVDIQTGETARAGKNFVKEIVNEFFIEAVTVNDEDFDE